MNVANINRPVRARGVKAENLDFSNTNKCIKYYSKYIYYYLQSNHCYGLFYFDSLSWGKGGLLCFGNMFKIDLHVLGTENFENDVLLLWNLIYVVEILIIKCQEDNVAIKLREICILLKTCEWDWQARTLSWWNPKTILI